MLGVDEANKMALIVHLMLGFIWHDRFKENWYENSLFMLPGFKLQKELEYFHILFDYLPILSHLTF